MKKVCIIFLLSIIISLTAIGFAGSEKTGGAENNAATSQYLRMHIRADSNDDEAQAVKYLVRDELVEYLTPLVADYESRSEALAGVEAHLSEIAQTAERTLKRNGYSYGARASVKTESFPTRVYDGYTLPAGEYTALIIELGQGKGDNWWCVVYPPLCFAAQSGQNVIYKSKIAEIIARWKNMVD